MAIFRAEGTVLNVLVFTGLDERAQCPDPAFFFLNGNAVFYESISRSDSRPVKRQAPPFHKVLSKVSAQIVADVDAGNIELDGNSRRSRCGMGTDR